MKDSIAAPKSFWLKTPFANLVRYVPSGIYFSRIRVRGKLIRRSLKTDTLSVAKLRLALRTPVGPDAELGVTVPFGRLVMLKGFPSGIELARGHRLDLGA